MRSTSQTLRTAVACTAVIGALVAASASSAAAAVRVTPGGAVTLNYPVGGVLQQIGLSLTNCAVTMGGSLNARSPLQPDGSYRIGSFTSGSLNPPVNYCGVNQLVLQFPSAASIDVVAPLGPGGLANVMLRGVTIGALGGCKYQGDLSATLQPPSGGANAVTGTTGTLALFINPGGCPPTVYFGGGTGGTLTPAQTLSMGP